MTHTAEPSSAGQQLSEIAAELLREFESDTMSACHHLSDASDRRQACKSRDALEAYLRTLENEHRAMREAIRTIAICPASYPNMHELPKLAQSVLSSLTLQP